MTPVVVGVDFGSSRIKASAYDPAGALVATQALETPVARSAGGDDFLIVAMLDTAAAAVRGLRLAPGSVAALGITSMGEAGTVLKSGELYDLSFPSWYDSRGRGTVTALEELWGREAWEHTTARHARVTSTVAKLGYLRASGLLPEGGTFLGLAAAFAFQLSGDVWQEPGLAATSGVFDVLAGEYELDIWRSAGLGDIALARVEPHDAWFPASTPLALSLGLAPQAPVVIAGHDHPVAAVGAGARRGEVVDSMGTGEALIAAFQAHPDLDRTGLSGVLDLDPYLSVEAWPGTGGVAAVWERMRPGLAMRTFVEHSGVAREELERGAPPPSMATSVTDAISLALEAGDAPEVQATPTSWGHLIDFYVLLANHGQALLRAATGATGDVLLTGGGLRSERWRMSKAVLGDGPMEISLVPETATRGAAAVAGAAAQWWSGAEAMPGAERVDMGPHHGAPVEEAVRRLWM